MKHKIKNRIAALLCSLAVAVPAVVGNVPSAVNQLSANASVLTNYFYYQDSQPNGYYYFTALAPFYAGMQDGHYNCWAYALRKITEYYSLPYPTDYQLGNLAYQYSSTYGESAFDPIPAGSTYTPVSSIDHPLKADALTYMAQQLISTNAHLYQSRLGGQSIVNNILADKPIITMWTNPTLGGHAMVIIGYLSTDNTANGLKFIEIYDPADGSFHFVNCLAYGTATYHRSDGYDFVWANSITL